MTTKVFLRPGIGAPASFDLDLEDLAQLAQCSMEEGIDYLLSKPEVDRRFAAAMRQTLQSGEAVLEIQQGTLTRVVVRSNPMRDFVQGTDVAPLEIGVSKEARGGAAVKGIS
jgi:hypothetical protein